MPKCDHCKTSPATEDREITRGPWKWTAHLCPSCVREMATAVVGQKVG